jgi:hypothetical protein
MKKLILLLSVVLFVSTSYASQNGVKLLATDNTIESNLCVTAGKEGYRAALKQAKKLEEGIAFRVKCNGESLRRFAENFYAQPIAELKVAKVQLLPANTNDASKICILAVKEGINAAVDASGNDILGITCNGLSLKRFSKKYAL